MRKVGAGILITLSALSVSTVAVSWSGSTAASAQERFTMTESPPKVAAKTRPLLAVDSSHHQVDSSPDKSVLARTAEILSVNAADLSSAFEQARQEVRRERVDQAIAGRVVHSVEASGIT